jgi:hypothetical protein
MYLELAACGPFSLSAVVKSHGWIQLVPFGEEADTATLTYVGRLASGRVVELAIREVDGGVSVDVAASLDEAEQVDLARQVTWMLGLDQDFTSFYELARTEPKLAQAVARRQGRLLRSPTLLRMPSRRSHDNTTWTRHDPYGRGAGLRIRHAGSAILSAMRFCASSLPCRWRAASRGSEAGYVAPLHTGACAGGGLWRVGSGALKTSTSRRRKLRRDLLALKGIGPYAAAHLLIFLGATTSSPWTPGR